MSGVTRAFKTKKKRKKKLTCSKELKQENNFGFI